MEKDRWIICGRPRSGKTYLMRHLLAVLYGDDNGKYIIYDPDYNLSNMGYVVNTLEDVEECFPDRIDYVVYQPEEEYTFDEKRTDFNELCEYLNSLRCEFCFAIDEISNISVKESGITVPTPHQFKLSVSRRAKFGMEIMVTTQQPKDSTLGLINHCTKVGVFDLFPHDIDYIERKIGVNFPKELIEMEYGTKERLILGKYEFFLYNHISYEFTKHRLKYRSVYNG